jgi:prepilin peptidase CpaA
MSVAGWIAGVAVLVTAAGAYKDARTGHIPNAITLGPLAVAPFLWFGATAVSAGAAEGMRAAGTSALGALVCALLPAFFFWRGELGGGDVKLLAATGALLGPSAGLDVELAAFVLAALWVPARLLWAGKLLTAIVGLAKAATNPLVRKERRHRMPECLRLGVALGPAIAVAVILVLLQRSLS